MNKQHNKILKALFAMVIMTSITANVAQAGESKDEEAKELKLFSMAKITLIEAIKAAEHKTGGKAMEAEVDDESNSVQFEVEILKDGKIHEVIVDGKTGKVLKVSLDDESRESTENEKE
ncbi:MAG: PepSY domain-containing protein [Methylococcales bacterium]|nr:PepSY domain-containing protein [Methylococcales bacterium]